MIQATLLAGGIGTLFQTIGVGPVGARLPLVLGTSFSHVSIAIAVGSRFDLSVLFGAVLMAGLAQLVVGRVIKYLRFLFPTLITGLFILLIGINLLPIGFALAFGGIYGTTIAGLNREHTDKEISGGVMADGLGSTVGAALGSLPLTTYSQNVGVIALTGVVSRHVFTIAGIFMILAGLFPKLAAIIEAMPSSVLGGVSIMMFGSVAAAGLKMLGRVELNQRNLLIAGLMLAVGVGLPAQSGFLERLPEQLQFIMETGLVPAAVLGISLNLILPGRLEH